MSLIEEFKEYPEEMIDTFQELLDGGLENPKEFILNSILHKILEGSNREHENLFNLTTHLASSVTPVAAEPNSKKKNKKKKGKTKAAATSYYLNAREVDEAFSTLCEDLEEMMYDAPRASEYLAEFVALALTSTPPFITVKALTSPNLLDLQVTGKAEKFLAYLLRALLARVRPHLSFPARSCVRRMLASQLSFMPTTSRFWPNCCEKVTMCHYCPHSYRKMCAAPLHEVCSFLPRISLPSPRLRVFVPI